jgi:multiple sugar transport system ATP-binding protein
MNFIPARIADPSLHLAGNIVLPIPESRRARYQDVTGRDGLLLGLRPEHLTDGRGALPPDVASFEAKIDVTEPMGMETLVYFSIGETAVCGRTNPGAGAEDGKPLRLAAHLNNMHIIDGTTGLVV